MQTRIALIDLKDGKVTGDFKAELPRQVKVGEVLRLERAGNPTLFTVAREVSRWTLHVCPWSYKDSPVLSVPARVYY